MNHSNPNRRGNHRYRRRQSFGRPYVHETTSHHQRNADENTGNHHNEDSNSLHPVLPGFVYCEATQRYYAVDAQQGRPNTTSLPAVVNASHSNQLKPEVEPVETAPKHQNVENMRAKSIFHCVQERTEMCCRALYSHSNLRDSILCRYRSQTIEDSPPSSCCLAMSSPTATLCNGNDEAFLAMADKHHVNVAPLSSLVTNHSGTHLNHYGALDVFGASRSTFTSVSFVRGTNWLFGSTFGDGAQGGSIFFQAVALDADNADIGTSTVLRRRSVWACQAMSDFSSSAEALVGCSGGACIVNLTRSSPRFISASGRSDVFSVATFSHESKCVLTGSRDGCIRLIDLRCSLIVSGQFKLPFSVTSLQTLDDGLHVMAATANTDICLLDTRMTRILQKYCGNVNALRHYPLCIDDTSSYVFACMTHNHIHIATDSQNGNWHNS